MEPDCLAKLSEAMERHPECDIAQCCLNAIDETGAVLDGWRRLTGLARYLGDEYLRPHIRRAPYDGVLHCAMHTVYHSITQVLIRRSTFAKTGPFPTTYGPGGDFSWGMKAGLHCDVVHVPEFLATWRIHPAQASATYRETAAERRLMATMVDDAHASRGRGSKAAALPAAALRFPYRYEHYRLAYADASGWPDRLRTLLRLAWTEPRIALMGAYLRLSRDRSELDRVRYVHRLLHRFALEDCLELLPAGEIGPIC